MESRNKISVIIIEQTIEGLDSLHRVNNLRSALQYRLAVVRLYGHVAPEVPQRMREKTRKHDETWEPTRPGSASRFPHDNNSQNHHHHHHEDDVGYERRRLR